MRAVGFAVGVFMMAAMICGVARGAGQEREAFFSPVPGLNDSDQETFYRGRADFLRSWEVPPDGSNAIGLGPLFNRLSCASCHQKNGRGRSPDGPDDRMLSMLVRLSIPGSDVHGGPRPHPAYGTQLNEEGVPGAPGEGRAAMHWQEEEIRFADGHVVRLRRPRVEFVDLSYGDIGQVLVSPRVGPSVFGLGLLEAVPVRELEAIARKQRASGVRGAMNAVWDVRAGAAVPGRFGHKANNPNLRQQIADAFINDLGITSDLFPAAQCASEQQKCRDEAHRAAARLKGEPEVDAPRLSDLEFYIAHLAPPARRNIENSDVRQGEKLFLRLGCAQCHVPRLTTIAHPRYPTTLPATEIAPYSDLLLHDMGPGLSDGRPDFRASGRQWRTPPLWGLGLAPQVNRRSQYLHDGRARNIEEAIVWHGGEAAKAKARYRQLSAEERDRLLAFLSSL